MSDLSGVTTNFFSTANEGFQTTLQTTVTAGATTIPLNDITGLVNGSVFVGIIEPGGAKQQVFTGTVDTGSASIDNVVYTRGSNTTHTAGVTIVDYITGTGWNMFVKGFLISHNQDGTLKTAAFQPAQLAPKVVSITSSATPTPNADACNLYTVTALAANATFGAPTGTPVQGQTLLIRVKDAGAAKTLAWNAIYRPVGVALPTTTFISKTLYLNFEYNATDTKWDLVGLAQEA